MRMPPVPDRAPGMTTYDDGGWSEDDSYEDDCDQYDTRDEVPYPAWMERGE